MPAGKYVWRSAVALLLCLTTQARGDDRSATTPPRPETETVQPVVRDVWYAYEDGGQRYGFEHVAVEKRDDGNFVYRLQSRLLVDLLGQRQEITGNGTFIVTPALEPVSLRLEGNKQSGATCTTGHIDGGDLVLTYEREGLRRTRRIDLSKKPLFLPCVDDWLRGNASAERLRRAVIDDASLELTDATFSPRDSAGDGAVWDVDLGPEAGRGTIVLGPDGVRTETALCVPRLRLRRVSAAEANDIKHRTYQNRELLVFPADRPIGPVQKLTALTVQLRWAAAGAEQLRLEDERQKVIERSTTDGETRVLVRIQPVAEREPAAAMPIVADQLRAYLAEGRFIKPRDPKVVSQTRIWMGDAQTPLAVVRALSRGVFTYMQGGSLIVETLPAPQILQCKQGKCSEFAILFASAARSAGIPTRLALGMRMVNGSWIGHMWNEAFVGRWITVDSTVDEVGSAPGLLKLVDSDSVDGTQSVRWAATEALQVSIKDFAPPPSDVTGKTGIDGSVYTNAEFACRLTAPHADWSVESAPQQGVPATVIRFKVPNHDNVLIHFVPIDVPAAITPQMLTAVRLARFKGMYQEFAVLKDEDYAVQRMQGRLLIFGRRGAGPEATKMKTTEVLWSDGTSCFLLNLIADEKAHDDYAADFFKLLGSFESLRSM